MRWREQIEVYEHGGVGYARLMDFDAWRVGYMRHSAEYLARNAATFQRHESCDEAFVLLRGRCCLITGGIGDRIGDIRWEEMAPYRVYVIPKGVWHPHLVDEDTDVLVIENSDVTLENSPLCPLDASQREQIIRIDNARRAGRQEA